MRNAALSSLRVLVIDDEPFQLKLLTQQFTGLGVGDVQTCQEAAGALARLLADPRCVDLICCDLQMPDMDGVEFVRHLTESTYGGGLMLFSGEDRRILQAAERLAASSALRLCGAYRKPVQREELQQAIAQAIAAQPVRRGNAVPMEAHRYSGADVAQAIAGGELTNHYQPKVELASGRVVGVETLVRWDHPQHGPVLPDQFIGVAEEHGLMNALTKAVLYGPNGAVQQARAWHHAGLALHVSVNVSMDDLRDRTFPDVLARALAAARVAPSQLIVEVTESRMMNDEPSALDILTRLRLKRVGVSIDDFGTGHSSLSKLRDMPFDELKIDRGFVHGGRNDASLRAILLPILDMARQLGIKTVAEGVEDADDWDYMRAQGCTLAQGYFIAKPMAPERVPAWVAEWDGRRAALALAPGERLDAAQDARSVIQVGT